MRGDRPRLRTLNRCGSFPCRWELDAAPLIPGPFILELIDEGTTGEEEGTSGGRDGPERAGGRIGPHGASRQREAGSGWERPRPAAEGEALDSLNASPDLSRLP